MIALACFTDGRWDVLERTLASADEMLYGPITSRHLFIDGDHGHELASVPVIARLLADPRWHVVPWGERRGFGGTIAGAWKLLTSSALDAAEARFVYHLEDDFLHNEPPDLAAMMAVLDAHPNLVQLSLKRQPWNDIEIAAGDFVRVAPDDYTENHLDAVRAMALDVERGARGGITDYVWTEQRRFFTTNPSLYRRELCAVGWPGDLEHSEGRFSHRLMEDPDVRFGIWGRKFDPPRVHHIGEHRVGNGY